MNGPCDGTGSEQFSLVPSEVGGWGAIATAVADMAASVDVDDRWWYLYLDAEIVGDPYVALRVHSAAVLAEVRHDQFWYEGPRLVPGVIDAMTAQGWSAPVSVESGLVNWWHTWPEPYDLDLICHELVRWFATGFALSDDVLVTLSAWSEPAPDGGELPWTIPATPEGPRRLALDLATDWSCLDDDDEDPITDEEWDVIEALSGPQDGRPKPKPSAEA